jgi:ketosteroid isomerase-like protein
MSEENVEMVRAVIDALNRGDADAMLKDAAPDFEFDFSRAVGPQRGVFGRDGVPGFFSELGEHWESIRYGVDEFIEVGEQVVTPFTNHFRGRDGIEVQARAALVWTLRDGAIARVCLYQERHEALEAAGLSESDG